MSAFAQLILIKSQHQTTSPFASPVRTPFSTKKLNNAPAIFHQFGSETSAFSAQKTLFQVKRGIIALNAQLEQLLLMGFALVPRACLTGLSVLNALKNQDLSRISAFAMTLSCTLKMESACCATKDNSSSETSA
ncbi:Hypothetical_protein [Hexamita inflata]|uniref:Hypothetical_protein n=1 Tax=Hexamita inflata TaxID=28002 RepID=A0ABP1JFT3_9EUKA